MKFDLPIDHPLAQAIKSETSSTNRIFINVDTFGATRGHNRLLQLEVMSWTWHDRRYDHEQLVPEHLTVETFDPAQRAAQLEAMLTWPNPFKDAENEPKGTETQ